MALCTECKSKIPTLARRLMRVNSELHQLGLEYHANLGPVFHALDLILVKHGFLETDTHFSGVTGRLHQHVGDDKWLSLTAYRMESGRYEIVAYVN